MKTDTPETDEAWDAVSRTPSGTYDSATPPMDYAVKMAAHARRLERERNKLRHENHCARELLYRLMREAHALTRPDHSPTDDDDVVDTIEHCRQFLWDFKPKETTAENQKTEAAADGTTCSSRSNHEADDHERKRETAMAAAIGAGYCGHQRSPNEHRMHLHTQPPSPAVE